MGGLHGGSFSVSCGNNICNGGDWMSRVNICQEDLVLVLVDFSKFRLVRWLVGFFQLLSTMILPFLLLLLLSLLDLAFVDAFIAVMLPS